MMVGGFPIFPWEISESKHHGEVLEERVCVFPLCFFDKWRSRGQTHSSDDSLDLLAKPLDPDYVSGQVAGSPIASVAAKLLTKSIETNYWKGGWKSHSTIKNRPFIDYLLSFPLLQQSSHHWEQIHLTLNCNNFSCRVTTGKKKINWSLRFFTIHRLAIKYLRLYVYFKLWFQL